MRKKKNEDKKKRDKQTAVIVFEKIIIKFLWLR